MRSSWDYCGTISHDQLGPKPGWRLIRTETGPIDALLVESSSRRFYVCCPDEAPKDEVAHYLGTIVLPKFVACDGNLVLHASMVATSKGAIGFLGASGQGKSTLSASLERHGSWLVSDDAIQVQFDGQEWHGLNLSTGLRLRPDSFEQLRTKFHELPPSRQFLGKHHVAIASARESARLVALFQLAEPAKDISIEAISSKDACIAILSNSFCLDPDDRDETAQRFTMAGKLAQSLPMFDLHYPRDFERLPEVHDAIFKIMGWKPSAA